MNTSENAIGAGGATLPEAIKVWDPFVRVFHVAGDAFSGGLRDRR